MAKTVRESVSEGIKGGISSGIAGLIGLGIFAGGLTFLDKLQKKETAKKVENAESNKEAK